MARLRVCVFCGANPGSESDYATTARELGRALADGGNDLVYGGASIGLMGALADGALAAGGHVVGVVPEFLPDGKVHRGLAEVTVVPTMHARKARMAELSDAFVVLPGGLGTLEEMFEALTWEQLGLHAKPLILLDINGFFGPLLDFLRLAHERKFILQPVERLLTVAKDVPEVIAALPALTGAEHVQ